MTKTFEMAVHPKPLDTTSHSEAMQQRGASLIVVMMVLTIVSLLGVAGIQIATMSEPVHATTETNKSHGSRLKPVY